MATKIKTHYVCSNCGASYAKQVGKCFSCGEFNTVTEEKHSPSRLQLRGVRDLQSAVTPIASVSNVDLQRIKLPGKELNRILGGGLVPGSVVLLGGEPGIGKSTLLLQSALRSKQKVLYVSGEESLNQIKLRADRIGIDNESCLLLNETSIESILQHIKEAEPNWVIIDSIQTMYSDYLDATAGTVAQIRESTGILINHAKKHDIPVIMIGHITKEGQLAGPKVLEHMVDAVLQFEGENQNAYRILRSLKNRFGSARDLGIYEMTSTGMREVENPSEILIGSRIEDLSGIAVVSSMEGNRPLLIETQALVSNAVYGNPQRNTNGYELKRLNMLLAVLEKRCSYNLAMMDVFVNIAGGLKTVDTATDLGIASAIASSLLNKAIPSKMAFAAEIGLSGEVRNVSRLDMRIQEAEKLGFTHFMLSADADIESKNLKIKLLKPETVSEAFDLLFS